MNNQTEILSNSLNNSTPNDILINLLPKSTESTLFSDSNIFWITAVAIFVILYLSLSLFPSISRSLRILISLGIPIMLDIVFSFGSFTFIFPFSLSLTTTHGVMFLKLIDYIFTYGLYTDYSNSIIAPYIASASPIASSLLTYLIVLLTNSIDSILEFIFLTYLTYTLITIIENSWHKQIQYQLPISITIGAIPTLLYMLFISNPLLETSKMITNLNGTFDFFSKAPLMDIIIVFVIIIINFSIITEIIFILTELALSTYTKINYSREDIKWTYSIQGIALMYTLTYSIIFMLHSDFKWYVVFPILLMYAYFKNKTSTYTRNARNNMNETQRISDITRNTIEQYRSPMSMSQNAVHDEFSSSNIIISLMVIAALVLIYLWYTL